MYITFNNDLLGGRTPNLRLMNNHSQLTHNHAAFLSLYLI